MNRNVLNKLLVFPYLKQQYNDLKRLKANACFPAGHFYSPIIDKEEVTAFEDQIWKKQDPSISGIELNVQDQLDLLRSFEAYYDALPFGDELKPGLRYKYLNGFYSYSDGIMLYSMIRHLQPNNIIEIGSGYSSAVMLDTNDQFFRGKINLTFIDPYPERLYSTLNKAEKLELAILPQRIQEVDLDAFTKLSENDILFVDSSHVVKTGSDLNHILFEILPRLKKGVFIHFHDIFYPFEYPKKWVLEGRNWNENYFLKAFLMHNSAYKIRLFTNYMHKFHKAAFQNMPLCYKNKGANIWIEKTC